MRFLRHIAVLLRSQLGEELLATTESVTAGGTVGSGTVEERPFRAA